ncbi:MAG: hypothetical protein PHQ66_02595 [Candidatus Nanoarchaeia archaeon]|nr:hypothetical protein [Candidatus Nanoarchaeia archaeon]MDD5357744.1 hypothetical protein [Candidatus Nanoarchaeia archaeon]MDD5588663.1 hypothetical protein [Candidatus Nanoarchaeia archaeon]
MTEIYDTLNEFAKNYQTYILGGWVLLSGITALVCRHNYKESKKFQKEFSGELDIINNNLKESLYVENERRNNLN